MSTVFHLSVVASPDQNNDEINQLIQTEALTVINFSNQRGIYFAPGTEEDCLENNFIKVIHNKTNVLNKITAMSNINSDDKTHEAIIVFTGHGKPNTGAWELGCDNLSFDEFMNQWKKGCLDTKRKTLTLILDSCYSGCWAKQLKKSEELQNYPIAIICASDDGFDIFNYETWSFRNLFYNESALAHGCNFLVNWLNHKTIEPPQRPVVYKTASYDSIIFNEKINSLSRV